MTTSSPNEPEGGGLIVYDEEGLFVGRTTDALDVPSEDVARVAIQIAPAVKRRFNLEGHYIDVEATWLKRAGNAPTLRLTKPLEEALREEGFIV